MCWLTGSKPVRIGVVLAVGLPVLILSCNVPARAWYDVGVDQAALRDLFDGAHTLDGSYVMNVGELHLNLTNFGLIGSQYSLLTTYSSAPSGQWPGGTGQEYLWAGGLWIGGIINGQACVSTGQYEAEFRPADHPRDTIYEALDGWITRPFPNPDAGGRRRPDPDADDDGDGRIDEERLDGYDDDGDGLVDEDFAQIGNQMMVCTMYDNTLLAREIYPDHEPLGLEVVMEAYAWEDRLADDLVVLNFTITNVSSQDIKDVYIGFFIDCDIGTRGQPNVENDDMVGYYSGRARASDGSYHGISLAYMYDGAAEEPLPGYFGVGFLGGGIRAFQHFTAEQPFERGGDPTNDAERYELMSRDELDRNSLEGEENDYRFLIARGPYGQLASRRSLGFSALLVCGDGLIPMVKNSAEAARLLEGTYWDLDHDPTTGVGGRETYVCKEWLPINPWTRRNIIYEYDPDYWGAYCLDEDVHLEPIKDEDLIEDEYGNHCIWVNMDTCEECDRRAPLRCTYWNRYILSFWNCKKTHLSLPARLGCTGIGGRESRVRWLAGNLAPPPPGLRLWARDNRVHVYWDDQSEYTEDVFMEMADFESYRVWRADLWDRPLGTSLENGPPSDLWQRIAEYDLVNDYVRKQALIGGVVVADTLPYGHNTGLEEIRYRPTCLDDPRFADLAAAMQSLVETDHQNRYRVRPHLRDRYGDVVPGLEILLPWEGYPTVLDTFFMVADRIADPGNDILPKRGLGFYEYIDHHVHNGFQYFYSVTTTDHGLDFSGDEPVISGRGQAGVPGTEFDYAMPSFPAQTVVDRERYGDDIFVFPNPATREALAEFQQLHPNEDDPTGLRIMFANLPLAHNTIKIFTLDGDLVVESPMTAPVATGKRAGIWLPATASRSSVVSTSTWSSRITTDSRILPASSWFCVEVRSAGTVRLVILVHF
ncbi:MAG: hypothetical protein ABIF77_07050 [bacterium]